MAKNEKALLSVGLTLRVLCRGAPRRDLTAGLTGAVTHRQIDRLVYELYGLADEDVRIVEGD